MRALSAWFSDCVCEGSVLARVRKYVNPNLCFPSTVGYLKKNIAQRVRIILYAFWS